MQRAKAEVIMPVIVVELVSWKVHNLKSTKLQLLKSSSLKPTLPAEGNGSTAMKQRRKK